MEDFINSRNLHTWKVNGQPHTFIGPYDEAIIYVTISTRAVSVTNRGVHPKVSSSDHRLMSYVVIPTYMAQQVFAQTTAKVELQR